MGAPASLTNKWIPEDDLLLKNAVEAGASLESLAKGAVSFTRRFSIRELQDRWHSLLYDLDTSSQASARIIEIENESPASNTTKTSRTCNSKGKDNSFGKRKADSVRRHYYAMRKRVCNGPCGSTDLSFLTPSGLHVGTGTYSGYEDQLKLPNENQRNDFSAGAPTSTGYGNFETRYDLGLNVFSEQQRVDSAAATVSCDISHHVYHIGHVGLVEDELAGGVVGKDGLFEDFAPVPVNQIRGNNAEQTFDHAYTHTDFPQITEENLVPFNSSSGVQEMSLPQKFPTSDLYENNNIEAKPVTSFDQTSDNHENLCSSFIGNDNLTSLASESNGLLQQIEYSSAPHSLPLWGTIEDIPASAIPMVGPFEQQDQGMFSADDIKRMDTLECDGATSETKLNEVYTAGLDNPVLLSDEDFMDFSSSYMDFVDDDDLFIDMDDKDITDMSALNGMSSVMLSSPSDAHQDDVLSPSNHLSTEVLDSCFVIPDGACSSEAYNLCDQVHSGNDDEPNIRVSEINLPSTFSGTPHTTELLVEFMICTINTEDRDIPCNDDVFLPAQVLSPFTSSNLEQSLRENAGPVSSFVKVLPNERNANIGDLSMVKEEQVACTHPHKFSLKATSSLLSNPGTIPSSDGCNVKDDPFQCSSVAGVSGHAGIAIDNSLPCMPGTTVALQCNAVAGVKEESKISDLEKHGCCNPSDSSFLEKSVQGLDSDKPYPSNINDGCQQEAAIQVTLQKHVLSRTDLVSANMGSSDPVVNVLTSDQEEHSSDNENDVPNFSDIESMILDMNLGPYDEESCLFAREVSRYQSVDAKKAIIRLEQGAHSYMNRAILSHGAFAIFYGRHLKYFIKEREVSLGRATEEVEVDINLSREGPANKISRLQALIKLDEDGTFALRNVGKCSVFINGKEVQSKKRTNLSSGSLIEVHTKRRNRLSVNKMNNLVYVMYNKRLMHRHLKRMSQEGDDVLLAEELPSDNEWLVDEEVETLNQTQRLQLTQAIQDENELEGLEANRGRAHGSGSSKRRKIVTSSRTRKKGTQSK